MGLNFVVIENVWIELSWAELFSRLSVCFLKPDFNERSRKASPIPENKRNGKQNFKIRQRMWSLLQKSFCYWHNKQKPQNLLCHNIMSQLANQVSSLK